MTAVTFETCDGIGVLRINRPEVHNAVDAAVMAGLERRLDEIERRDLRALILTGAGRSFCAGGDLRYFAGLETREQGAEMSRRMGDVLRRLAGGPLPVIAAINGDALGGGCEVLLACHLRIASETARFSFRQAAMGVVTGWGGGVRVLRLLGRSRALELLLTADRIDAAEDLRVGLVESVVAPERLMAEALGLARRIAGNAPESVAAFLDLARTYERDGGRAAERREAELFAQGWVGEHFRRKVTQWSEGKEKPDQK